MNTSTMHAYDPVSDRSPAGAGTLLRISGLTTHFFTDEGVVRAVDGADLDVPRGRTVCVVGESGCGKSITARSVLRLVDRPGRIVDGRIDWHPDDEQRHLNVTELDPKSAALRRLRGGDIGMVFQEPMASLSPMYTIGDQLTEVIRIHLGYERQAAREHGIEMLNRVGIPRPDQRIDAYPFELSGGMCQRAMIAIALSCSPELLIADEPTTALDVTTQARILRLLSELQAETGMSMLFITHDLGVVAEIADDVAVMYLGRVVERGPVERIFGEPRHPYTRALLRSIPRPSADTGRRLWAIRGMVPHPRHRPEGCPFHTRCGQAIAGVCDTAVPPTVGFGTDHRADCHLYGEAGPGVEGGPPVLTDAESATDGHAPGEPDADEREAGDDGGATGGRPTGGRATTPAPEARRHTGADADAATDTEPLMRLEDLRVRFGLKRGMFGRAAGHVHAVDGVDLAIRPGETLGLVGESGCGKTTLGRCLARVLRPSDGRIRYRREDGTQVDPAALRGKDLLRFRKEVRVIFQDPFSSLNPRMTLEQLIGEPLRNNRLAAGSELRDRVAETLRVVGLRPEYMRRYPHAFSGGERQRINIARALVTEPRLVIADEAVSALDVSVRAQILNLLAELQERFDLTYLFISHDLSVVEHLCDRVSVMYLGQVVESAPTDELFHRPRHPYTEALLHAVPRADPALRGRSDAYTIPEELPDPTNPPAGCRFHARCPYVREDRCTDTAPALDPSSGHPVACHHADSLRLGGLRGTDPTPSG